MKTLNSVSFLLEIKKITWQRHLNNISFDYLIFGYMDREYDAKRPWKKRTNRVSVFELFEMFPDETSAREWFEDLRWQDGRYCGHCGSENTYPVKNKKPMPFRCTNCRSYFSIKTGTVMQSSRVHLRKRIFTMYLMTTSLKGVSSMKLHRDLGTSHPTAWFMAQRIREGWEDGSDLFCGTVEVGETYMGRK